MLKPANLSTGIQPCDRLVAFVHFCWQDGVGLDVRGSSETHWRRCLVYDPEIEKLTVSQKKNQQTNDVFVRRFLVCTHIQNRFKVAILYMRTHQKSSDKNIVCLLIFFLADSIGRFLLIMYLSLHNAMTVLTSCYWICMSFKLCVKVLSVCCCIQRIITYNVDSCYISYICAVILHSLIVLEVQVYRYQSLAVVMIRNV